MALKWLMIERMPALLEDFFHFIDKLRAKAYRNYAVRMNVQAHFLEIKMLFHEKRFKFL